MTASEVAGRRSHVDTLRGLSILVELLLYLSLTDESMASPLANIMPRGVLEGAVPNSNYGVTMFFAVLGFLIADRCRTVHRVLTV